MNFNSVRSRASSRRSASWDFRADVNQSGGQNFRDAATQDQESLARDVAAAGGGSFARSNRTAAARALQDPAGARARWARYTTPVAGAASGGDGGGSGGESSGSGGDPNAQPYVTNPVPDAAYRSADEFGLFPASKDSLAALDERFSSALDSINGMADRLVQVNEAYLNGELQGDVVAEIRRNAAERAVQGGAGADSQAARNLRARDLGVSSLQLQTQGIQQAGNIASMRQTVAQLAESKRQFDSNFALNTAQFLDQVRGRDLSVIAMEQERLQFNARQNLAIVGFISELATARAQVSATLAANGVDSAGTAAGFTQIISQLDKLLGG